MYKKKTFENKHHSVYKDYVESTSYLDFVSVYLTPVSKIVKTTIVFYSVCI